MTVEQAMEELCRDWYAYMTGDSSSERLRPGGYKPLIGLGRKGDCAEHDGYLEVEKVLKMVDVNLTKEWLFIVLSGGTEKDLINRAKSLKTELEFKLRERIASKPRVKEFEEV